MRILALALSLGIFQSAASAVHAEFPLISAAATERKAPRFLIDKGCTFYSHASGRGKSLRVTTTKQDSNLQRSVVRTDVAQWWNGRLGSVRCDFSPPVKCYAFHRIVQGWDALSTRLNANGNLTAIAPGLDWRDKDISLSVVCSMAR